MSTNQIPKHSSHQELDSDPSSHHMDGSNFHGGFPCSSAGKKSTFNAGGPSLIAGLGRSPGEGIGYPLWYSLGSLVAQMVKNLPAAWETWV